MPKFLFIIIHINKMEINVYIKLRFFQNKIYFTLENLSKFSVLIDFHMSQTQSLQKSKNFDSVCGKHIINAGRCISEI